MRTTGRFARAHSARYCLQTLRTDRQNGAWDLQPGVQQNPLHPFGGANVHWTLATISPGAKLDAL